MHIQVVIRNDHVNNSETVEHIVYGDNTALANHHVSQLVLAELESQATIPQQRYEREVTFSAEESETDSSVTIVKQYKRVVPGYVYNSHKRVRELVCTFRVLAYDDSRAPSFEPLHSGLWGNINQEINHRVMKKMDKESLYQVLCSVESVLLKKVSWTGIEYIAVLSETLRTFKKDLYSNVARRMQRFGNRFAPLANVHDADTVMNNDKAKSD